MTRNIKRLADVLFCLTALFSSGAAAADLNSLVKAEIAFSNLSELKGTREAFLSFLAADSVVFRPKPIPGMKAYADAQDSPGRLSWKPVFADISISGDLGYTTGPYEFRKSKSSGDPSSCGDYVSIWGLRADGTWKVLIDAGIGHPCGGKAASESLIFQNLAVVPSPSVSEAERTKAKKELLRLESELSEASKSHDSVGPLLRYLAEDARVCRPGAPPCIERDEIGHILGKESGEWTWTPAAATVSGAADMGFTYGTAVRGRAVTADTGDESLAVAAPAAGEFVYLRIWKRDASGAWKIALDLQNPVSPGKSS